MYYGDQRESMVNISYALEAKGWKIYGYHADQSDSMTDYYCPASWDGLATKNGYVLCVDIKDYDVKSRSGYEVFEYTYNNVDTTTNEKIQKLQALANDNAATEGEKQAALNMIEKLQNKQTEQEETREKTKVLKFKYPEFMANPTACNWHVEKDGKIFAKGKGAFQFSSLPYDYDPSTGQIKEWRNRTEPWTENEQKEINKFLSFVAKINNVAIGVANMGDGTEETEAEGIEAEQKQGYEKVIVPVTKTVTKPVEIIRTTIQKDDILKFKTSHGGYWLVTEIWQNSKNINCYTYEILGSEKRGFQRLNNAKRYYMPESRILKYVESGEITIHEMKTFDETTEVEKWVKIDQSKKVKTTGKKETKETNEQAEEQQTVGVFPYKYTITQDTDTRDNSNIWVVKITDKLDREEFKKKAEKLVNELKGYYSRFKHGFLFKYDPAEVLKGNNTTEETEPTIEQQPEQQENPYEQPNIEDGYTYNCHFKAWSTDIQTIQNKVNELGISWIDWSEKIGFKGITAEQTRQLKEISDENGSIFFIDKKEPITIQEQQPIKPHQFIKGIAYQYGVNAFFNGLKRIPAGDQKFLDKVIAGLQVGEGTKYLEEWLQGWDDANLDKVKRLEELETEQEEQNEEQEGEERQEMFDNDILGKFDNIEVNNDTRISTEDQEYCQEQERMYSETFDMFLEFYNRANEWKSNNKQPKYSKYIENYSSYKNSVESLRDAVFAINHNFISAIIRHFSNKYNITIDNNKIEEKLIKERRDSYSRDSFKDALKKTNYKDILEQVFIQLGGFSFEEKAVKELKDSTKIYYYNDYRNSSNMNIKNNKLAIDNSYAYKDWDTYRLRGDYSKIFTALYHFDNGTIPKGSTELHNKYCGYDQERNQSNFEKYEPYSLNKVTGIKFFKNGKLEIEFKTNNDAFNFAKEYCGYIPQQTAAK